MTKQQLIAYLYWNPEVTPYWHKDGMIYVFRGFQVKGTWEALN